MQKAPEQPKSRTSRKPSRDQKLSQGTAPSPLLFLLLFLTLLFLTPLSSLHWPVVSLDGPDNATEDAPPPEALLLEVEAGVKRKRRAKDVFGRTIATAEEFPQLVNAPKYVTSPRHAGGQP